RNPKFFHRLLNGEEIRPKDYNEAVHYGLAKEGSKCFNIGGTYFLLDKKLIEKSFVLKDYDQKGKYYIDESTNDFWHVYDFLKNPDDGIHMDYIGIGRRYEITITRKDILRRTYIRCACKEDCEYLIQSYDGRNGKCNRLMCNFLGCKN